MTATVRLGTIAGIRVGVHWSVLLIFGLLLVGLSTGSFPSSTPATPRPCTSRPGVSRRWCSSARCSRTSSPTRWSRGVKASGCEGITLWVFGGVAKLTGEATTRTPAAI
jgi:hypothetical protein